MPASLAAGIVRFMSYLALTKFDATPTEDAGSNEIFDFHRPGWHNLVVPKPESESVDDYLKAIFELTGPAGEAATSNAIAQRLGVSAPSVTGMLRKLSAGRRPCIAYRKHHGARLTGAGRKRALRILRRHRLVELFLCQVLGYSWDEVHEEAERLEHFISEKLEERIAQKLGNPEFDPHGDTIPAKDGTLPERKTVALAAVPPGSSVIVSSVSDRDPEMLRYLKRIGLAPNRLLAVIDHGPLEGPTTVRLHGEAEIRALGPRLAAAILVRMP
jgi:DtxR family Mn-dependent transcriptional regulator